MSHTPQTVQLGLDNGREALRHFLAGEDDVNTMLGKITQIATEAVPGCDLASITIVRRGEPATPVFTDKAAGALDETQYDLGDGPCLAAIRHRGLEQFDATSDTRWPGFGAEAKKLGVLGCLSVPISDDHLALGALNLYSKSVNSYDQAACEAACLFADQLGIAPANATTCVASYELVRQLQQAMESRAVIEQPRASSWPPKAVTPTLRSRSWCGRHRTRIASFEPSPQRSWNGEGSAAGRTSVGQRDGSFRPSPTRPPSGRGVMASLGVQLDRLTQSGGVDRVPNRPHGRVQQEPPSPIEKRRSCRDEHVQPFPGRNDDVAHVDHHEEVPLAFDQIEKDVAQHP